MAFSNTIYNLLFRRNSIFVGTIFVTAFFTDIAYNTAVDKYFDSLNKGKQWKDISYKYIQDGDGDGDDDDE